MPKSAQNRPSTTSPRRRGRILAGVTAVLASAALLAVATVQFAGTSTTSAGPQSSTAAPQPASSQYAQLAALARRDASDPYAIGRVDAPVVMIEYADFQCPFCSLFAKTTEPSLVTQYVDTGVLRLEWRNFPIFGTESEVAARAGWAAGQQGRFWDFYRIAYQHTPKVRNSGAFSADNLVAIARSAGVPDLARFRRDMDSQAAQQAVARDQNEGNSIGIPSTPAFIINGRPLLGDQPADQFRALIEQARNSAAHPGGAGQ